MFLDALLRFSHLCFKNIKKNLFSNLDETAVHWPSLSIESLVLLVVQWLDRSFLQLLLEQARTFDHLSLLEKGLTPIIYKSSKKSWMNRELFEGPNKRHPAFYR